jgi:chromosomal replication initiation ATPase DnaA
MNDDLNHPVLAEGFRFGSLSRFEKGLEELRSANRKTAVLGIIGVVSGAYGLEPKELLGRNRCDQIATARMVSMWLCRQVLELDYATIGRFHGNRHSSTVIYAAQAVRERREVYPRFLAHTNLLIELARRFTHETDPTPA